MKTIKILIMSFIFCLILTSCTITTKYTITLDGNGGVFSDNKAKETLQFNENAKFKTNLEVKYQGYRFLGWFDEDGVEYTSSTLITSNVTLYAKWEEDQGCQILYVLDGGTILGDYTKTHYYGTNTTLPVPRKAASEFLGWFLDTSLTGEAITELDANVDKKTFVYAKWGDAVVNSSLVFVLNGGLLDNMPTTYLEGSSYVLPTPNKDKAIFSGWYDNIECEGEAITSIPKETFGEYTVYADWADSLPIEYELNGGTLPDDAPYVYQEGKYTSLKNPTKENYYFKGFFNNPEFEGTIINSISTTQTGTVKLYAKWVDKCLANATISILGDSISTFQGYIPDGYPFYYPTYSNVGTVSQTWWYRTISGVGATLNMNASYSGGTVCGTSESSGSNALRITRLKNGLMTNPDIIIVYLGINDVVNGVSNENFKNGYKLMLDNIQTRYKQADIFLCTLGYETYTNTNFPGKRDSFNAIINELALEYEMPVIDFASVITINTETPQKTYLNDNIHPNSLGMMALSNKAISTIKDYYNE